MEFLPSTRIETAAPILGPVSIVLDGRQQRIFRLVGVIQLGELHVHGVDKAGKYLVDGRYA